MTSRNASLILLGFASLLVAGLWFLAGEAEAPRTANPEPPLVSERQDEEFPLVRSQAPSADTQRSAREKAELPLAEPSEVAGSVPGVIGRVLDPGGVPVEGARIFALLGNRLADRLMSPGELLRRSPEAGAQALTDAKGHFRLPLLAAGDGAGEFRLSIRAKGFAPLDREIASLAPQALGDLVLEQSAILNGHVRDPAGKPVASAVLRRLDPINRSGSPVHSESGEVVTITDAEGAFRIDELASGPWKLLITSERHPDSIEQGSTERPGEVVTGLVFVLVQGVEIQGRVVGPAGALEDLWVHAVPLRAESATDGQNAALPRRARCKPSGEFAVKGLRTGWIYRLGAWRADRDPTARPTTELVEARGGSRDVTLVYQPETTLVFRVVDAASGVPITELEARAGCGFLLPLAGEDGRIRRDFPGGLVQFPILFECDPGGEPVELALSARDHDDLRVTELRIAEGQRLDLGVLRMEPLPTVSVLVLSAAGGQPIEGAEVVLHARSEEPADDPARVPRADSLPSGAPPWVEARTDQQGRARLNGPRTAAAVVRVRHPGFSPLESEPLSFSGLANQEVHLRLHAGGRVEVEVVDTKGVPVPSLWLRRVFVDGPPNQERMDSARTDSLGQHVFERLEAGLHRFEIAEQVSTAEVGERTAAEVQVSDGSYHAVRLVVPAREP